MDLYFKHSGRVLTDNDIHLVGIGAMYIASKYEDIYYINLREFHEKVGHKKFSE
jgi:hypothetical protein